MTRSAKICTKVSWLSLMALMVMACNDDPVSTVPISKDLGTEPDMTVEADMSTPEPDMAEEDMGTPEPDMPAEVDMAEANMEVSGTWVMRTYADQTPGDEIVTFSLVNPVGATEVTGTYQLPEGGEMGEVEGTYQQQELELTWETSASQIPYTFLNGALNADTITGQFNDPAQGGIPANVIMERQTE